MVLFLIHSLSVITFPSQKLREMYESKLERLVFEKEYAVGKHSLLLLPSPETILMY